MPVPDKSKFDPIKAVIAFRAPGPEDKPINREKFGRGNFIWSRYRLWFQKEQKGEDKFYVYQTDLDSDGSEQRPGRPIVVESDSKGTYDSDKETDDIRASEVEKIFPKWFGPKGPKLFPDDAVTYVNMEEDGKSYDKQTFLKNFLSESYIVVDKTPTLKNIKGKPIGVKIPEEKNVPEKKAHGSRYDSLDVESLSLLCPKCGAEKSKILWGWPGVYYDMVCSNGHDWTYEFKTGGKTAKTYGTGDIRDLFRRCVRAAKEKDEDAISGGFDIMRQFQRKQKGKKIRKKGGQNDPKYFMGDKNVMKEWKAQGTGPKVPGKPFSGGFGILRKWQLQHGAKPETAPSEFTNGFDIMRQWQKRHRKTSL